MHVPLKDQHPLGSAVGLNTLTPEPCPSYAASLCEAGACRISYKKLLDTLTISAVEVSAMKTRRPRSLLNCTSRTGVLQLEQVTPSHLLQAGNKKRFLQMKHRRGTQLTTTLCLELSDLASTFWWT